MADGSITIDTKLDNRGFDAGSREMQNAIKSLGKAISDTDRGLRNTVEGYSAAMKQNISATRDFEKEIKSLELDAANIREAMSNFGINSHAYKETVKELKAVRDEAAKLAAIGDTLRDSEGFFPSPVEMEKWKEIEKQLDALEEKESALVKRRDELANPSAVDMLKYNEQMRMLDEIEKRIEAMKKARDELASRNTIPEDDGTREKAEEHQEENASVSRLKAVGEGLKSVMLGCVHALAVAGKGLWVVTKEIAKAFNVVFDAVVNAILKLARFLGTKIISALKAIGSAALKAAVELTKLASGVVISGLKLLASTAMKATIALNKFAVTSVVAGLKRVTVAAGQASAAFVKLSGKGIINGLKGITGAVLKTAKALMTLRKHTHRSNNGFKTGLKTILRYAFGVRSTFFLVRRLRTAIKEGFQQLAKSNPEVESALNSLKKSLNALKGSLAGAFSPILTAVAPILTQFMDMLSEAINKLGQFFAALTGQAFYNKAVGNINKTTKAASKLENQLASFDKLDILQENKGGGSGSDAGWSYQKVAIESAISDFAEQLKAAYNAGQYERIGDLFAQKINKAIEKIKNAISWKNVGPKLTKVFKGLTDGINGLVKGLNWTNIGNTIGEGVNTIVNSLNLLLTGIDWKAIGRGIANGINGLAKTVNFTELGKAIANYFLTLPTIIIEAIKTIDWKLVGKKLGEGLNSLIKTIKDWLKDHEKDWPDIGKKIAEGLNALVDEIDWDTLGETLGDGASGLITAIVNGLATFNIDVAVDGITKAINGIVPKIGEAIDNLTSKTIWSTTTSGTLVKKSVVEKVGEKFGRAINNIFNIDTEGLGKTIAKAINAAISAVGAALGEFKFSENGKKLADGFNSFFDEFDAKGFAENIATFLVGLIDAGVSFFLNADVDIAAGKMMEAVNAAFSKLSERIAGLTEKTWMTTASGTLVRKSEAEKLGEKFGAVLNSIFTIDTDQLGKTIANAINAAVTSVGAALGEFEFAKNGQKLAKGFNAFFEGFDAEGFAKNISTFIVGLIDAGVSFFMAADIDTAVKKLMSAINETLSQLGDKISGLTDDSIPLEVLESHPGLGMSKVKSKAQILGEQFGDIINSIFTIDTTALAKTIASSINAATKAVGAALGTIEWGENGKKVGEGFNEFFNDFDADTFAGNVADFLIDLIDFGVGFFMEAKLDVAVEKIFSALATAIQKVGEKLKELNTPMETAFEAWEKTGSRANVGKSQMEVIAEKLADALNASFQDTNIINSVSEAFEQLVIAGTTLAKTFVEGFKAEEFGAKLGEALGRVKWDELADKVQEFFEAAVGKIADALYGLSGGKEYDFWDVDEKGRKTRATTKGMSSGEKLTKAFNNMIASIDTSSISLKLTDILGSAADFAAEVITGIDWGTLGEKLRNALEPLFTDKIMPLLQGMLDALVDAIEHVFFPERQTNRDKEIVKTADALAEEIGTTSSKALNRIIEEATGSDNLTYTTEDGKTITRAEARTAKDRYDYDNMSFIEKTLWGLTNWLVGDDDDRELKHKVEDYIDSQKEPEDRSKYPDFNDSWLEYQLEKDGGAAFERIIGNSLLSSTAYAEDYSEDEIDAIEKSGQAEQRLSDSLSKYLNIVHPDKDAKAQEDNTEATNNLTDALSEWDAYKAGGGAGGKTRTAGTRYKVDNPVDLDTVNGRYGTSGVPGTKWQQFANGVFKTGKQNEEATVSVKYVPTDGDGKKLNDKSLLAGLKTFVAGGATTSAGVKFKPLNENGQPVQMNVINYIKNVLKGGVNMDVFAKLQNMPNTPASFQALYGALNYNVYSTLGAKGPYTKFTGDGKNSLYGPLAGVYVADLIKKAGAAYKIAGDGNTLFGALSGVFNAGLNNTSDYSGIAGDTKNGKSTLFGKLSGIFKAGLEKEDSKATIAGTAGSLYGALKGVYKVDIGKDNDKDVITGDGSNSLYGKLNGMYKVGLAKTGDKLLIATAYSEHEGKALFGLLRGTYKVYLDKIGNKTGFVADEDTSKTKSLYGELAGKFLATLGVEPKTPETFTGPKGLYGPAETDFLANLTPEKKAKYYDAFVDTPNSLYGSTKQDVKATLGAEQGTPQTVTQLYDYDPDTGMSVWVQTISDPDAVKKTLHLDKKYTVEMTAKAASYSPSSLEKVFNPNQDKPLLAWVSLAKVAKKNNNPTWSVKFTGVNNGVATLSIEKEGGILGKNGPIRSFWGAINKYAGGTSSAHGSLFLAGEAGPEVVGHVGGRTEVLNKSQIAQAIYNAVVAGMTNAVNALGRYIASHMTLCANAIISAITRSHGIPNMGGVDYRVPLMASGTIMPYEVAAQVAKTGSDIQKAIHTANDELMQVMVSAMNTQTNAIVEALRRLSGNGASDITTQKVIDEINRRTRVYGTSPLLGV